MYSYVCMHTKHTIVPFNIFSSDQYLVYIHSYLILIAQRLLQIQKNLKSHKLILNECSRMHTFLIGIFVVFLVVMVKV